MNRSAIGVLVLGSTLAVGAYADSDVGEGHVHAGSLESQDHHTMHDQVTDKPWEFYGMLYAALQRSDAGNALDHSGDGSQTNLWLSTDETTLGFRGSVPLDNGLKAIWQIESSINLDEFGDTAGHAHGAQPPNYNSSKLAGGHNSFIGLSGDWGIVLAGKHNTPFFDATIQFDLFHHIPGDLRAMLGRLPGVTSGSGDHHGGTFNVSASDTIMYKSPELGNGFSFEGAIFALNETLVDDQKADPSAFGVGARWQQERFTLVAAYEQHKNYDTFNHDNSRTTPEVAIDKTSGFIVGGMMHFNDHNTMVGAFFEQLDMNTASLAMPSKSRDGYYVNFQQRFMTKNKVKLALSEADTFNIRDGGQTVAIALAREIGAGTEVYTTYATTNNKQYATYSNGTTGPLGKGGDPRTLAVGIVHKF